MLEFSNCLQNESEITLAHFCVLSQDQQPQPASGSVVRNMNLEQDGNKVQLALWGKKTTSPVKIGDKVRVSHVKVIQNTYLQALSLKTTAMTEIKVCIVFRCTFSNYIKVKFDKNHLETILQEGFSYRNVVEIFFQKYHKMHFL